MSFKKRAYTYIDVTFFSPRYSSATLCLLKYMAVSDKQEIEYRSISFRLASNDNHASHFSVYFLDLSDDEAKYLMDLNNYIEGAGRLEKSK